MDAEPAMENIVLSGLYLMESPALLKNRFSGGGSSLRTVINDEARAFLIDRGRVETEHRELINPRGRRRTKSETGSRKRGMKRI